MQTTVYIAAAIDEAYVLPLKVMLSSLREHLGTQFHPVLFLLHRKLSDGQVREIAEIVETRPLVPGSALIDALPRHRNFIAEASFPLLLGELLPGSIERILFLDPDLLVLDDVGCVWNTDLGENVLAAAIDQAIPRCSSPRAVKRWHERGISMESPYFNAGVMLIDLRRWRDDDIARRAFSYLAENDGATDFIHQEALNAVLWNRWMRLDEKWNVTPTGNPRIDCGVNPAIVHFAGYFKPWKIRMNGPYADAFRKAARAHGHESHDQRASLSSAMAALYYRYCREYLHGFERALWRRRMI